MKSKKSLPKEDLGEEWGKEYFSFVLYRSLHYLKCFLNKMLFSFYKELDSVLCFTVNLIISNTYSSQQLQCLP